MSRIYSPGFYPMPYVRYNPYRHYNPYYGYPYYPQYNIIRSQSSNINQNLINTGYMMAVNQIANSNNIMY